MGRYLNHFMKAFWQLFSGVLGSIECEEIKAYAMTFPAQQGAVGHGAMAVASEMR